MKKKRLIAIQNMKDSDTREAFVAGRAHGTSYAALAAELSVSRSTLLTWGKDLDTQIEIDNRRTLEIEALHEQYMMSRRHRVAALGDLLAKARKEIASRDLSDLPTDKLVGLSLQLEARVAAEVPEKPLFRSEGFSRCEVEYTWDG